MPFRAAAVSTFTSTSMNATWPTGLVTGDDVWAMLSQDNNAATITRPTGWTLEATADLNNPDTQTIELYRLTGGYTGSTPAKTWTSTIAQEAQIVIAAWSGRDVAAAPSIKQVTQNTTSNSSAISCSMTGGTATAGDDIGIFVALDPESPGTDRWALSNWGGGAYTERIDSSIDWNTVGLGTRDSASAGATGSLAVTATRTSGSANSGYGGFVLALVAGGGPTFDTQPSAAHKSIGQTATFTVAVSPSGGGTISGYQWKKNGTDVSGGSGGTTASYTTDALTTADDGAVYTCAVTESGGTNDGTATSTGATLRIGVIFVAAGSPTFSAANGTSVSPDYPAGIAAGDKLLLFAWQKPSSANGGTLTTPGSWSRDAEITGATDGDTGGYTTTLGADTGNVNLYQLSLDAAGTETGTLAITVGTNSVTGAIILCYRKPPGTTWSSVASVTGKDTSSGTGISITGASNPGCDAGDTVIGAFTDPTDVNTTGKYTAQAFTQTGCTFSTATQLAELFSSVGNDIGGFIADAKVLTGPSSAAPVLSATASGTTTNVRGPGMVTRLRANLVAVGDVLLASGARLQRNNPAIYNM